MLLRCALLCGALVLANGLPAFPNIGYLGAGYDIFYGNPHSLGQVDPGFRPSLIQYNYNGQTTADNMYALPDGVTVRSCTACALSWDTDIVSGSSSYKHTLERDVEFDLKIFGASFSASTDYQQVQQRTSQYKDVYTKSAATCYVYCGQLQPFGFEMDRVFSTLVSALPQSYDATKYFEFLSRFGTHVATDVTMGGNFGQQSQILESSWTQMRDTLTKVQVSAGFSAKFASASASVMTSNEINEAEQFSSHTESQRVYTVGGQPPADGQSSTWAAQTITQPMPVRYTLQSMSDFLQGFESSGGVSSAVVANVAQALTDYCPTLVSKGVLSSCDPPPPDPPLPGQAGSCRLCADSCGGNWPIETGAVCLDQPTWSKWALDLASVCTANTYTHNSYQTAVKLCCSTDSPSTSEEYRAQAVSQKLAPTVNAVDKAANNKQQPPQADSEVCRFCVDSCGSSWPTEVGALGLDQSWSNFFAAHRPNCLDGYRTGSYSVGIKFCCRSEPDCAICTSCGGDYTVEAGAWATDKTQWTKFFLELGDSCEANTYDSNKYSDGVKLCCKA